MILQHNPNLETGAHPCIECSWVRDSCSADCFSKKQFCARRNRPSSAATKLFDSNMPRAFSITQRCAERRRNSAPPCLRPDCRGNLRNRPSAGTSWRQRCATTAGRWMARRWWMASSFISAHHVRFIPHDPKLADLYVDFHPEETELLHHPGQAFGALGTTKILVAFRFSKLCLTCAPGTPIPAGINPALLDQEFQLVQDGIKHFDSSYRRMYLVSAKIRVEVRAQNQPGGSDVPDAMRLYSDLNRQLAEVCPEPARSCIRSYAVYQACIADHGGAKCGAEPNCSAACPVSMSQVQNLKARACVQLDQQGASLIPDWTDVVRRKNAGGVPLRPLPPGVLEVQFTSGPNPPAGLGCSVKRPTFELRTLELRWRVRRAQPEQSTPRNPSSFRPREPTPAPPATPSATPAERHTTGAAATPGVVATAKPSSVAPAKPSTPSVAKPAPVPAERSSTVASAKPAAAAPGAVASRQAEHCLRAKPAPVPAEKPSTVASADPSPAIPTKPSSRSRGEARRPSCREDRRRYGEARDRQRQTERHPLCRCQACRPQRKIQRIRCNAIRRSRPPCDTNSKAGEQHTQNCSRNRGGNAGEEGSTDVPARSESRTGAGDSHLNVTISKTGAVTAVDVVERAGTAPVRRGRCGEAMGIQAIFLARRASRV